MALTIGKVARAARVHVETLRYYERRGLVPSHRGASPCIAATPEKTVTHLVLAEALQLLEIVRIGNAPPQPFRPTAPGRSLASVSSIGRRNQSAY